MKDERLYSTRELAQMWNVSESTVKRWADSGDLSCYRTPGGHRKFRLQDICDFQAKRGFEATGLLTTEQWDEPDVELSVNKKNYERVRNLIQYLAVQNQRIRIRDLLERLYLRGMEVVELYDEILVPVLDSTNHARERGELKEGLARLADNNVEEAVASLFPRLIRRRQNGKTAMCAAPDRCRKLPVNALSRILEVEGWESLNLGNDVTFEAMSEVVREEPVNLVCVVCERLAKARSQEEDFNKLYETAAGFRVPIVLAGAAFSTPENRASFRHHEYSPSFRSFRDYLIALSR